jgi:caprin-1
VSSEAADITDPVARINEIVAKRVRNLDKRLVKLAGYEKELLKGHTLQPEQKEALEKRAEVLLQLEQLRELKETFAQVTRELEKADKVKVG